MTTKMIATRGDGVTRCCVVLLLLLLGVPSGQTQCVQKVTECNRLLMNSATELSSLFTPPYNATALETACSSARQNLTDCVREANETCSGQPDMLGSLVNSSISLDFYCGPAFICQLKATTCQAAVVALLPTGPPSGNESETTGGADLMQKLCPAYEQAAQCLQALTATDQCREVEAVKNMTSSFAMVASSCATGVPSGQTQCLQTLTECSTLLSNFSVDLSTQVTPPYNVTAVETACRPLTNCVREANESCSGQPDMLGSLDSLLTSLDSYCGPALICQLKATACQAAILAVLPTGPPSGTESETTGGLQNLCPLYEQAAQCLQNLTATDQCSEVEAVKNVTSIFAMSASSCAAPTGGQACPQSFGCFSAFMSATLSAGQCTAMQTFVGCLSGLKGTCTFDESKITLTDLQSLMTSVCTETLKYPAEYGNCSAVVQCGMTSPTLGLSALSSVNSTDIQELLTIMTKLTDPAFLCSYLQVMVDCSVSQAQACQYNNQYVAFMKTQQQSLQPRCSKAGQNTGDGSTTGQNTGDGSATGQNTGDISTTGQNTGDGSTTGQNTGDGSTTRQSTGDGSPTGHNTGDGSTTGQNTGDGSTTDDESGGERSSGHAMHWVLTAVTSLTAALLFGL